MNGAYILSQLWNGPSDICDISTTLLWHTPSLALPFSPTYTLFFSYSLTHSTSFSTHPCPFLSFRSRLLYVISPSSFLSSVFSSFPHLLPFCSFLANSSLFSACHYLHLRLKSYLCLLWSFMHWTVSVFASPLPPQLTLSHLLNLSTCLYLCLLSAVTRFSFRSILFISFSFFMLRLYMLSLFVFLSLLCLETSRQGCWQRWARAYLKCHWQSDKRSYGK